MSMYQQILTGKWSKVTEGVKGVVDASETARVINGTETDENYKWVATVKINAGKAALIVNFTYSEDWEEQYLEMVLDPTNKKVTLEAVVRNVDGTEKSRETLASRDVNINLDTEYECVVISKLLSDGQTYAVYGVVDGFITVEAEDLSSTFQKGMRGFECLGNADEYSVFTKEMWLEVPED